MPRLNVTCMLMMPSGQPGQPTLRKTMSRWRWKHYCLQSVALTATRLLRCATLFHIVYTNAHMFMQHTSGCTAMQCAGCKTIFCMWCRSIFAASNKITASDACHNHIWTCGKRPMHDQICTQSVLFPCNEEDRDFMSCYFSCHKLSYLAQTVCASWSAAECKRLVRDVTFQTFLVNLKERQQCYRQRYPDKEVLLAFCFHKTIGANEGTVCVHKHFPTS